MSQQISQWLKTKIKTFNFIIRLLSVIDMGITIAGVSTMIKENYLVALRSHSLVIELILFGYSVKLLFWQIAPFYVFKLGTMTDCCDNDFTAADAIEAPKKWKKNISRHLIDVFIIMIWSEEEVLFVHFIFKFIYYFIVEHYIGLLGNLPKYVQMKVSLNWDCPQKYAEKEISNAGVSSKKKI